jgi:hypothetical protein
VLLLSAWASAAGPVRFLTTPAFSGVEAKAPGQEYATGPDPTAHDARRTGPRATSPFVVDLLDWVMKLLLAVVVLAVLVVVTRALLERWFARGGPRPETAFSEVLPETLLERARESEALLARGTPTNAVIAAWLALEEAVRSTGVGADDARTAAELVTAVLRAYAVRREPLDRLAELYREARFSRHPIEESMRTEAAKALRLVQDDLRSQVRRRARSSAVGTGR